MEPPLVGMRDLIEFLKLEKKAVKQTYKGRLKKRRWKMILIDMKKYLTRSLCCLLFSLLMFVSMLLSGLNALAQSNGL